MLVQTTLVLVFTVTLLTFELAEKTNVCESENNRQFSRLFLYETEKIPWMSFYIEMCKTNTFLECPLNSITRNLNELNEYLAYLPEIFFPTSLSSLWTVAFEIFSLVFYCLQISNDVKTNWKTRIWHKKQKCYIKKSTFACFEPYLWILWQYAHTKQIFCNKTFHCFSQLMKIREWLKIKLFI